ncbi:unnamed protein product [Calypogeia fissa]
MRASQITPQVKIFRCEKDVARVSPSDVVRVLCSDKAIAGPFLYSVCKSVSSSETRVMEKDDFYVPSDHWTVGVVWI